MPTEARGVSTSGSWTYRKLYTAWVFEIILGCSGRAAVCDVNHRAFFQPQLNLE